jgi:hypothetical protein
MLMLVHLLSLLDLFAALAIFGGHFGIVHMLLLYAAIYLLAKLFFFRDALSIIDTAAALYALYMFFAGHGNGLTWLFLIYFMYKTSVWLFFSLTH